ncbi:uncharacterized protein LOC109835343 [Asparagus officinalis]|uniref:uncharacterized protein LOC109835343 n=1 Tax=Asparagus officinalis TaxID=4686 RepID=UPI00098DF7C7|nr:uncharacterized protein LOC109835343 [Asparagus officinalis]
MPKASKKRQKQKPAHYSYSNFWSIQAKTGDSWMWKQILKIRNKAQDIFGGTDNLKLKLQSCCRNSKIKVSALYNVISPASSIVTWHNTIWESINILRHSFICWLAVHNRLLTQDRLLNMGIMTVNSCCFCSGHESRDHLFFECAFSKDVWVLVME